MENKINITGQEPMLTYSHQNKDALESNFHAAATHPSVSSRNLDDLFKRIRSGDDVLCRLPPRLGPNVQFSEDEDEDEEDQVEENGKENKIPEVDKTPEFKPRTSEMLSAKFRPTMISSQRSKNTPSCSNPFNQRFTESRHGTFAGKLSTLKMNPIPGPAFKVPATPLESKMPPKTSLRDEIIEVNKNSYSVISLLGTGGSCKVFSAIDLDKKFLVAIKCVDLKNTDPSIREGYEKEIAYLRKLQKSNRVIKMYDYEYRKDELFIVLERGEVDFAKYISNEAKLKSLSPLMIKFYWAEMLEAVSDIHKYGIVHSDLKPSNFLIVAGKLKLIDFGIAASVPDDKTSTFRDTQVGTLNYMSPEAITQMSDNEQIRFKVGVKSDVWSLGCILYNLVYGVTPFHNVKTLMQKIHAITNPNYEIVFKPLPDKLLVEVLKLCLKRDPKERASVDDLLRHPYLTEDEVPKAESAKSESDLNNVLEKMQSLTPRRRNYAFKVIKELSEKQI